MPTPMKSPNSVKQGAAAAPSGDAIGRAETVTGEVTLTHVSGEKSALSQNTPIYQGDLIETGADGKVSIIFIDGSTFALSSDGSMVMDELVYDPSTHEGQSVTSVTKGVFVFVSGEIANHNPDMMVVRTPVMSIGVRGTKVAGTAAPEGQENKVALLPEEDGSVGVVVVSTDTGSVVLDTAYQLTRAVFDNVAPMAPEIITQAVANELFGEAIMVLPILNYLGGVSGIIDTLGNMFGSGSNDSGSSNGGSSDSTQQNGGSSNDSGGGILDDLFMFDDRWNADGIGDDVRLDPSFLDGSPLDALLDSPYGAVIPVTGGAQAYVHAADEALATFLVVL
jgi:hypothetical protein